MSRKANPIVGVLRFFETASLELATTALDLAKATVKARTPPTKPNRKRKLATPPVSEATPLVPPTPAEPVPERAGTPGHRMVRPRRAAAPAPATTAETGHGLPGLGPATVGD